MNQSSAIIQSLQNKGIRTTKARTFIIETLSDTDKLLSAGDIQTLLQRRHLPVNKTTVYRELEFLKDQKIVEEIDLGEGKKRYELATTDHHHHIICVRCDQIEHISLENDLIEEEKHITQRTNYKILHHTLEFFGVCTDCQKV